jgi:hypothetical protein
MFDLKGKKYLSSFIIDVVSLGMGENNCSWNRRLTLKRETLLATQAIYQSKINNNFHLKSIYFLF